MEKKKRVEYDEQLSFRTLIFALAIAIILLVVGVSALVYLLL